MAEAVKHNQPHNQQYPHGYFADSHTGKPLPGPVVHAGWCVDGSRDMTLDEAVLFVSPDRRRHYVPGGFRVNGLSVPRILWRLVQPFEPLSREASVVHDWLCVRGEPWGYAAWVFWAAMRANGVGPVKAWLRWAAVRYVGIWFQKKHRR